MQFMLCRTCTEVTVKVVSWKSKAMLSFCVLLHAVLLLMLQGKLPALPGQRPNMGDWENHLTTIFPEVRTQCKLTVS
jgi:gamma-glutamylcysteine synthetase